MIIWILVILALFGCGAAQKSLGCVVSLGLILFTIILLFLK